MISVTGTLNREKIRQSLHTRDWKEATRIVSDAEGRGFWKSSNGDDGVKRIFDCYAAFLADAASEKGRGLRESTMASYKTLERKLRAFCEERGLERLTEITPEHVRQFRDSLPVGPRTAANTLVKLGCFFRFTIQNEWLPKNPVDSVKPPKVAKGADTQKQPFSKDEMAGIFQHAAGDSELTTLIWLMRTTGLRISDAVFLKRSQTVDGYLKVKTLKSGSVVTMPIEPHVWERLQALPETHGDNYFVNAGTRLGTATDLFRRRLNFVFKAAGIKKGTPHLFRHTFSVSLLEKGVSMATVSLLLGHSSIGITERFYASFTEGRKQALADDLRKTWEPDKAA